MRSAPSVMYPVGRSVLFLRMLVVVGALGIGAAALAIAYGEGPWALAIGVAWAGWVGGAMQAWYRQPRRRLAWTANAERPVDRTHRTVAGNWPWFSAAYVGGVVLQRVERVHDLQAWMLLACPTPMAPAPGSGSSGPAIRNDGTICAVPGGHMGERTLSGRGMGYISAAPTPAA